MPLPLPLIDHVIVNARDGLDAVAERYAQLGFVLTPRGHHTIGSINHLAMFGTDYIELLGVADRQGRTDVLDWPRGLNGLVFKTLDSDGLHATLSEAGLPVLPPTSFSRPVETAAGMRDAAFRNVRFAREAVTAGRMFFCHHRTPDLVWTEGRGGHPNGTLGIAGMWIAAENPAGLTDLFAQSFGRAAVRRTAHGAALCAGLATVEVMTPSALVARLGSAAPAADGRAEFMAALVLRTNSLDRAWAEAPEGRRSELGLVVPAAAACGTALIFRE